MDGHQKADIKVDDLLVNPENYRFDPVKNQQDAMRVMLRNQKDKILRLARDIAQRGLNPTRRLVVKEADGGKYVIQEGNRRITALKLIINPAELPEDYSYRGVFEELHDKYKDTLPTEVECVIYPADQQDIADSWVLLEHTGENQGVGTVPWTGEQKLRFELRHKQKLSSAIQILDLLRDNGVDTSGVLATNVERLLTTPQVRQALGLDFTNKQLILFEPQADVIQKLTKVVERMQAKGFSVGDIYKVNDRLKWIQDVLRLQPAHATPPPAPTSSPTPTSTNGSTSAPTPQPAPVVTPSSGTAPSPSSTTSAGKSSPTPPQPPPMPSPAPTTPSVYYSLVNTANLLPSTIPPKIIKIYKELQTVHVSGTRQQAPHAVAALLRILIEITAQEYLMKKHGFWYDSGNHFRKRTDPANNYDELRDKLNYIANSCGLPRNIAQVLKTLIGRQLMTAELNQVMHNTIFLADAAALKGIWQNFENVFDYLIDEMK